MSDRYTSWIRDKLAEHAPEATADPGAALQLAHAWAALAGKRTQIFGMELPPVLADREVLRDECMATLRRWIPTLDKAAKDQLRQVMTGYAVPLG